MKEAVIRFRAKYIDIKHLISYILYDLDALKWQVPDPLNTSKGPHIVEKEKQIWIEIEDFTCPFLIKLIPFKYCTVETSLLTS